MIRTRFVERSRRGVVVLSSLVLALALGAPVLAGHLAEGVKSYTGCLTTQGGTLTLIREGSAPAKACPSGSTEAHFSGGDITGVTAGFGLTGGGSNGAVSIALDPKYGLRQDCTQGQILEWDDLAGAWTCAADDDTTYTAGDGLVLNGTEFSLDGDSLLPECSLGESATVVSSDQSAFGTWGCQDKADADQDCTVGQFVTGITDAGRLECAAAGGSGGGIEIWEDYQSGDAPEGFYNTITSLALPAGTFVVTASGTVEDDSGFDADVSVVCRFPEGGLVSAANSDGTSSPIPIILQQVLILPDPTTVVFECTSLVGDDHLSGVTMTALQVGTRH